MKYTKYLGLKHDYHDINCITLLDKIYREELQNDVIYKISKQLSIASLKQYNNRRWMHDFNVKIVEECISKFAIKINLPTIQEYDVILFKHKDMLTHFGMYIGQNRFIHVEENKESKIDSLNDKWRGEISSIWRHVGTNM